MVRTLRLHPDARPARRAEDEVQFGLFPDCGLVLAGLTDAECDLLLMLHGTVTDRELLTRAVELGVPRHRVHGVLELLQQHQLLVPERAAGQEGAPAPAAVAVHGHGLLADRLREALLAGGQPPDAPGADIATGLVVSVARGAPALGHLTGLEATPVLPVVTRATGVVVGPVLNGSAGPRLTCIELHRRDRDGARPRVLAQVAAPVRTEPPEVPADDGLDPALAVAAAGLTLLVVRAVSRGLEPPPGRSWELTAPWPEVITRRWTRHPACRCPAGGQPAPA